MDDTYLTCSDESHIWQGSLYAKDKVPYNLFKKNNSNELYKTCIDCRNYTNIKNKIHSKENKEKYTKAVENKSDYIPCLSPYHDNKIYPKDKVPKQLFIKNTNNPNSSLTKSCLHCRHKKAKTSKETRKKNRIKANDNGLYYCTTCNNTISPEDRSINLDGTLGEKCKFCQQKQGEHFKSVKTNFVNLKFDYIEKYQSCCYLCNKIFIINDDKLIELETQLIDNIRYLEYNNNVYTVNDFIKIYKNIITVDILHFDHLTEDEQRERKILTDDKLFIPKTRCVSQTGSEEKMKEEALKCQLLCGLCHLIETMRRENNTTKSKPTIRKKINYVNELKKEGCSICHYINVNLPRFFHCDHIDPSTKIDNISNMVHEGKYSFEHLIKEMKKCRIICLHCHMRHTKEQWNNDLYRTPKNKEVIEYIETKPSHIKIKKYDYNDNFIEEYDSISQAARKCGISRYKLYDILNNKYKHPLFKFKTVDT